jgi:RND family efflux transporter MFP subunit
MVITFQNSGNMKYFIWLLIGLLSAGCGKGAGEREEDSRHEDEHENHAGEIVLEPEVAVAAGVRTGKVQAGGFAEVIQVSGSLVAAQSGERKAVAPSHGVVDMGGLWLTEGKPVKEGDPLLRLVSGGLEEGDVVVRTKAAYEKARRDYERVKSLVGERIVSGKEYDEAETAYEAARTAYEALAKGENGEGVAVRAPMGGYLKDVFVKEGDYVERGAVLFTVSGDRRLALRAEVPEKHFGKLGRIGSANFRTSYGEHVYRLEEMNGRLIAYGRSVGEGSFYLPVTFEFENTEGILPGGYAEVWLLLEGGRETLSVPVGALIEEQGIFSVFVKTGREEYRKRRVWPGGNNGAEVEIVSGLEAGEEVVTEGAYVLKLASSTSAIPAHNH